MHAACGPATGAAAGAGAALSTARRGRRWVFSSGAQQPPRVHAPRDRRRLALPDTGLSAHGCAALLGVAAAVLLVSADPAQAGEQSLQAGSSHGGVLFQLSGEDPEFWTNMGRYARFAVGTGLGMFYTVARPLVDLLRKPTTAVPLVIGIIALTKLLSWTLNAMLGLDADVQIVY